VGAAVLGFGLGGCDRSEPASPPPAPTPAPSTGSVAPVSPVGSEGLTVRYLDADGKIRTLDVENFPR